MYKKILLIFLLLVMINAVNASRESEWLVDQGVDGNWGGIRETAFSILALNRAGGYTNDVLNGSRYLNRQLESCMLTDTCNVKDTAVAVWALNEVGQNAIIVNDAGTWLLNSRNIIFTEFTPEDEWHIQIISGTPGNCILSNQEGTSVNVPAVIGDKGYIDWFRIDTGLLTSGSSELNLDCSSLGRSDLVLSVINKKTVGGIENYYIKQEEHGDNNITVSFGIPCWGNGYRDNACGTETTAYVLYVLDKIGKTGDPSWLTDPSRSLGLVENGFLFKITNNAEYLTYLATQKNEIGYWGTPPDLSTTAILYELLEPNVVTDGVGNWIASRRHGDGCWPKPSCSVEQSALVLYSGAYATTGSGCDDLDGDGECDIDDNDIDNDGLLNNIDNNPRNSDYNSNGILDGDDDYDGDEVANKEDSDIDGDGVTNSEDEYPWDETRGREERRDTTGGETVIVGSSCVTNEGCEGERNSIGDCVDIVGDGCPSSDYRSDTGISGSDGYDDFDSGDVGSSGTTSSRTGRDDGGSVLVWLLWVIALLIALVGGGYLAYKKGLLKLDFIKKGPKPEAKYQPRISSVKKQGPYIPRMAKKIPRVAKHIEHELDQSMKDLERLLGKK